MRGQIAIDRQRTRRVARGERAVNRGVAANCAAAAQQATGGDVDRTAELAVHEKLAAGNRGDPVEGGTVTAQQSRSRQMVDAVCPRAGAEGRAQQWRRECVIGSGMVEDQCADAIAEADLRSRDVTRSRGSIARSRTDIERTARTERSGYPDAVAGLNRAAIRCRQRGAPVISHNNDRAGVAPNRIGPGDRDGPAGGRTVCQSRAEKTAGRKDLRTAGDGQLAVTVRTDEHRVAEKP